MYRIRRADENESAADIERLENETGLPRTPYGDVTWWLAFLDSDPVAYLGALPSPIVSGAVYLARVGVLPAHRGNGLQLRLMRALDRDARIEGFESVVSDTTDNPPSANNFIRAGYRIFEPRTPWAYAHSIYWRKAL